MASRGIKPRGAAVFVVGDSAGSGAAAAEHLSCGSVAESVKPCTMEHSARRNRLILPRATPSPGARSEEGTRHRRRRHRVGVPATLSPAP